MQYTSSNFDSGLPYQVNIPAALDQADKHGATPIYYTACASSAEVLNKALLLPSNPDTSLCASDSKAKIHAADAFKGIKK